jgi:hypothetical protein
MRIFLVIIVILLHSTVLRATESSFKFTFGSNLGNFPLEINKMSKNLKQLPGVKINSWTLSPNFSSFVGKKKLSNFSDDRLKETLYIKLNFKF